MLSGARAGSRRRGVERGGGGNGLNGLNGRGARPGLVSKPARRATAGLEARRSAPPTGLERLQEQGQWAGGRTVGGVEADVREVHILDLCLHVQRVPRSAPPCERSARPRDGGRLVAHGGRRGRRGQVPGQHCEVFLASWAARHPAAGAGPYGAGDGARAAQPAIFIGASQHAQRMRSYDTRSPLKNMRARGRVIFLFFPRAASAR
jgi:hypothetical protein